MLNVSSTSGGNDGHAARIALPPVSNTTWARAIPSGPDRYRVVERALEAETFQPLAREIAPRVGLGGS